METKSPNIMLKYISLVTLTVQNAALALSMRYARTRQGHMFFSSTAVLNSEIIKLITCLYVVYRENNSVSDWIIDLKTHIKDQPMDTLKVCIPSLVYVVQNNLLYVAASHLDAATYQVTYQLKILTTAVFSILILKRKLIFTQWGALMILLFGVILVQLAQTEEKSVKATESGEQNRVIGFLAAIAACCLSGFAGIYFEKILKGSNISVWMRNVQLSLCSIPFALITCLFNDYHSVTEKGYFYGYDGFVWYLVILQAVGGLLVAMVVKYADNILKGFATSLAIVLSCIASIILFNFQLTGQFSFGTILVICSIFLYGYQPATSGKPPHLVSKVNQKLWTKFFKYYFKR